PDPAQSRPPQTKQGQPRKCQQAMTLSAFTQGYEWTPDLARKKSDLLQSRPILGWAEMSTAKEIKAAILALPPNERQKLVNDLPAILPELDGDSVWAG